MINRAVTARYAAGSAAGGQGRVHRFSAGGDGGGQNEGARAVWARVRETLRKRLGDVRFDNWIARLEFIAEVDGEILIAAPGELERDRVTSSFGHLIQQAWLEEDRRARALTIEARGRIPADVLALAGPSMPLPGSADEAELDAEIEAEAEEVVEAVASAAEESGFSLDAFLVGESNRVAHGIARRIATGATAGASVVTLVGPHGVGKTHLLRGVESALRAAKGEEHVLYLSAEEFTVAFVEGVKRKDTSDLRSMVRRARVVLLDDFQFICSKPGTLVEFFSHLRAIVAKGGVVMLACDQAPATFEQLDSRMRDEVLGGVVARVELPEPALRRQIVRSTADAAARDHEGFDFEDEWCELIADRLPSSGRALAGAVSNILVSTVLAGQPVTRAAVEAAMQNQLGSAAARAPKIDTIKDVTARIYGVTKQDLESACRKRQFALPRQYAMYLSRKLTTCSYPQIGRHFGGRDHTTVLFAFRKISGMAARNEALVEELRQLEQKIMMDPRNLR
jgi:chromosomal replication initiator protein